MTKKILAGLVVSLMFAMGCQSMNTSLERNANGSYTLTSVKAGFFRVYSTVHNCTGDGMDMSCRKIDTE